MTDEISSTEPVETEEVITTTESEDVVSEQEDINTIISNITESHQRDIDAIVSAHNKTFQSQENKIRELLTQIEDLKNSKQEEIEKSCAVLLENIAELTQKVEELQSQSNLQE